VRWALLLSLFAGQAAVIAVSPVLAELARDLGVSTSTAGQLRAISGIAAGVGALLIGPVSGRLGLRDLLLAGLAALALASLLSAAATSFAMLAAAQLILGGGLALVLSAGLAAAAEWSTAAERSRALSWALIGQPAAWIVGMPLVGAAGDLSWRLGWLVPLAAALTAAAVVSGRPRDAAGEAVRGSWRLLRDDRAVAGWALSELLAYAGWAGILVYAGALLVESYGVSAGVAGVALGAAAVAYLPGNFMARTRLDGGTRILLTALPPLAAAVAVLLGAWRPGALVSALLLSLLAVLNGGRTIAGSALGLELCSQRRVFAMRIRAAATQFGYLGGAALGGLALAIGGYPALGATFAALFLLAAVPHASALLALRRAGPLSRRPG
jgi:MFS transporter, DHA1 family, inner membrane transport protein